MDKLISSGRFVTALAKRLAREKDARLLYIFEKDLVFLHSQADALGMSLKKFYEGALEECETTQIKCGSADATFESDDID